MYRLITECVDAELLDETYMASWIDAARSRGLSNDGLAKAIEIVYEYF